MPYLVGAPPLEEQMFRKIAEIYNGIRKGFNSKNLLLLQISVCGDKMGIIGVNYPIISPKWCGFEYLQYNN